MSWTDHRLIIASGFVDDPAWATAQLGVAPLDGAGVEVGVFPARGAFAVMVEFFAVDGVGRIQAVIPTADIQVVRVHKLVSPSLAFSGGTAIVAAVAGTPYIEDEFSVCDGFVIRVSNLTANGATKILVRIAPGAQR